MSSPISGFTAIPNPQMLAFMPIQSYLMMYFAGAGWQIGKRKISAIPNDKFNKMSAKDLLEGFTADLRGTIPTLERSLKDITPLIATLIEQYGEFVTIALKEIPQAAQGVIESQFTKEGTIAKWLIDQFKIPEAEAFSAVHRQFGTIEQKLGPSPTIISTGKPFQGPGINTITGEQSEASKRAVEARVTLQKAVPQVHVKARPRSNVSLQSLTIEKSRLTQEYTRQKLIYDKIPTQNRDARNSQWTKVKQAELNYANFFKMHGSRFR